MKSFALTGYRGTGKDTLIKDFQLQDLLFVPIILKGNSELKWVVYTNKNRVADFRNTFNNLNNVKRYAFADKLKLTTHEELGFLDCPAHAFERMKDVLEVMHPKTGVKQSIRNWYIEVGERERKRDPLVWSRIVHEEIVRKQEDKKDKVDQEDDEVDIISDWRYPNELIPRKMGQVITIRLFRKDVPIPPAHIDSEHALDKTMTDFLFLPDGEWQECINQFPQYKDFVPHSFAYKK